MQGITIDPENHLRVFAATPQGMFKSENSRSTWSNVLPQAAWNITFVAADSHVVYATSKTSGVYKSRDGGASWHQVNVDLADTSVAGLAMDPERPKTLYVSAPTGVYKTVTGGE